METTVQGQPVEVGGKKYLLRDDGRLWKWVRGGSLEGLVPESNTILEMMEKDAKLTAKRPKVKQEGAPPKALVKLAAEELLRMKLKTEAWVVFFRERVGGEKKRWAAVVPRQEVSMAGASLLEFDKLTAHFAMGGFVPAGSLHLHPGDGTGQSATDEEFMSLWGGIHCIVGRSGDVSWYLSLGEEKGRLWKWKQTKVKVKGRGRAILTAAEQGETVEEMLMEVTPTQRQVQVVGSKWPNKGAVGKPTGDAVKDFEMCGDAVKLLFKARKLFAAARDRSAEWSLNQAIQEIINPAGFRDSWGGSY